jgi:hypothetical protein
MLTTSLMPAAGGAKGAHVCLDCLELGPAWLAVDSLLEAQEHRLAALGCQVESPPFARSWAPPHPTWSGAPA